MVDWGLYLGLRIDRTDRANGHLQERNEDGDDKMIQMIKKIVLRHIRI